jgi:radical SAM protein with 4Fe4S-binding SPASM domain
MNLYISPNGDCYPCYALMDVRHYLGNAITESLDSILDRNNNYHRVTVDSNCKCRTCTLRYLCGGFCRAWSKDDDPDAPLPDCAALYQRAERILHNAIEALEIDRERWKAADLPWPRN